MNAGLLRDGEIEILGRMPWSSNATFLVDVVGLVDVEDPVDAMAASDGGTAPTSMRAVYKPGRGERPLWDFPGGLFRREVAAYELARALAWDLVPLTVARADGPFGAGSLQEFVDADFTQHYFTLAEDEELWPQFQRIAVFDVIANNTDRKSGHCLIDADRHIWGIDNGLCFSAEPKLRTVIWEYAGEAIPTELLDDLDCFAGSSILENPATAALSDLLDPFERAALEARIRAVLDEGRFPTDTTGHAYPWPLV